MKKENTVILLLLVLGIASCTITRKLEKNTSGIRLTQPSRSKQNTDTVNASSPKLITYTDPQGTEHTVTRNETDKKTGEEMSVIDLQGVTVTAKSKNVSERFGKVNLDFIVTVPNHLISNKWQLRLTPVLTMLEERIELERLFLSGADFLKTQQKGYDLYQAFINSIVPDSAYLQHMFNSQGYEKAMAGMEEEFYQTWKRDLLFEKEFIDWNNKVNQRYLLFNGIVESNLQRVKENSLLSRLPSYWMFRDVESTATPGKYRNYLSGDYRIIRKEITPEDSVNIAERYFNYKKIAENERKKEMLEDMYKEYVRFPYEKARLDTIIRNGDNFQYYYVQEIATGDTCKKLDLTLEGMVLAKDESTYQVPASDTITYYISSMIQFLDRTPRYKLKVIERKAEVNLTSYISYKSGRVTIDETLGDNNRELAKILETIHKLTFSGELVLDSINMMASASPEGSAVMNHTLSGHRANELKKYLTVKTDDKDGIDTLIRARWIGEDWNRLIGLINQSEEIENKQAILDLIASTDNPDKRENEIRNKYKTDYAYIRDHLYPDLRSVTFNFNLHRRGMVKDTIHTTVVDDYYQKGITFLEGRKYKDALTVLSDYNDYNTAICLMSLGYDTKAFDILSGQEDNANRNYLLSILAVRLGKTEDAVRFLVKACEQDETKIWRGKLDPEINTLMNTYNLYQDEN